MLLSNITQLRNFFFVIDKKGTGKHQLKQENFGQRGSMTLLYRRNSEWKWNETNYRGWQKKIKR